ncbi:mitochondrial branched-chain alpha-ketoacid dehydrogenase kinase-domain-containing protein [Russula vinacea]|nr:mitochondrial branched-chain alpha-ketoacid dehydrogenase kinase-domain-containing protein [Russula vinacea]
MGQDPSLCFLPQTGVSLQQMVQFGQNPSQGTLLRASQFLLEELPVRLAHRAKELDELPHNLSSMPSIQKVKNWYAQSFEELIDFPPISLPSDFRIALNQGDISLPVSTPNPAIKESTYSRSGDGNRCRLRIPIEKRYYARTTNTEWPPEVHDYNKRFTKALEDIKRRHDPTVTTVAQGVLEWKHNQRTQRIGLDVQAWLDRFYMSRIGIRFLIGQHVALNTLAPHQDYVGIICTRANVHDIVHEAIENARYVCEEHYGMFKGPPVQLICPKELHFAYVPGHLSHICFELLKNSLRAVVERYGHEKEDAIPPIKVIVVEGKEDITIKITDEGGGMRAARFRSSGLICTPPWRASTSIRTSRRATLTRPWRALVWSSALAVICAVLWWRLAPHLHGRFRHGRLHPPQSSLEQHGASPVASPRFIIIVRGLKLPFPSPRKESNQLCGGSKRNFCNECNFIFTILSSPIANVVLLLFSVCCFL